MYISSRLHSSDTYLRVLARSLSPAPLHVRAPPLPPPHGASCDPSVRSIVIHAPASAACAASATHSWLRHTEVSVHPRAGPSGWATAHMRSHSIMIMTIHSPNLTSFPRPRAAQTAARGGGKASAHVCAGCAVDLGRGAAGGRPPPHAARGSPDAQPAVARPRAASARLRAAQTAARGGGKASAHVCAGCAGLQEVHLDH